MIPNQKRVTLYQPVGEVHVQTLCGHTIIFEEGEEVPRLGDILDCEHVLITHQQSRVVALWYDEVNQETGRVKFGIGKKGT